MIDLTEERRDALTELLNIGFGRSIASLAEMLRIYIQISVPSVRVVQPHEIADMLAQSEVGQAEVTLIQQSFRGEFNGEAVLALPGRGGHALSRMLKIDCGFSPDMEPDKLHMEVLLEIGNILIGACLGKFAEILNILLSFNPPQIFQDSIQLDRLKQAVSFPDYGALLILTRFQLQKDEVTGYMFIFINSDFLETLFQAVDRFLEDLG
jgi:chemotaxis protein CheC